MSFTDFNVDDFIAREARQSSVALADASEVNPDEAGRARQLAEATGADPTLVLGDLKNFEKQHKIGLGTAIADENQFIQEYLRSTPIAAKISSDDIGQLDAISQSLRKFKKFDVTKDVVQAFRAGADPEGFAKERGELYDFIDSPAWRAAYYTPVMQTGIALAGSMRTLQGLLFAGATGIGRSLEAAGVPEAWANRGIRDIIVATQTSMPELALGVKPYMAMKRPYDPWIADGRPPPVGVDQVVDQVRAAEVRTDETALFEAVAEAAKSATRERAPDLFADFVRQHTEGEIYVSADAVRSLYGDKPPSPDDNLLGWVPRLREQLEVAEATGGDIAIPIPELMAHADPAVLKELKDFIRYRPDGMTLEETKLPPIQGEANFFSSIMNEPKIGVVVDGKHFYFDLYKLNDTDFGIDMVQHALGGRSGKGVEAYLLAANELDKQGKRLAIGTNETSPAAQAIHRKLTERGLLFEDNGVRYVTPQKEAKAVEDMRRAAGMTPSAGRKVTLERAESTPGVPPPEFQDGPERQHKFNIKNEKGDTVADIILVEEDGGKRLFVDDIASVTPSGHAKPIEEAANTLGPRAMRDVLEQIKEQFPNAEVLEGMRVSGAREKVVNEKVAAGKEFGSKDAIAQVDLTKLKPRKRPEQLELPQDATTRMEDRDAFEKGAAIGMTVDQYKRYQKLIEKQSAEDQAYYTKKAIQDIQKRQTAEWKAAEIELRPEVVAELKRRPDIAADDFFRDGRLFDQALEKKPRLNEEFLTPEQIEALPKSYVTKTGMHPDDAASLLGFKSGKELVDSLAALNKDRVESGLRPIDYTRQLVAQEIERRMQEKFGDLTQNIIEEAKERVLSQTQIDMLHEETLARATEAGLQFSITKEQLRSAIQERFEGALVREIGSDKFFADAARANKAAEMALLKGDPTEAFRQKQRAYIATVMARESLEVEILRGRLDKVADRFSKREVKGVEQESVNYIQGLLSQAGYKTKMSPDEIAASIAFQGKGSLRDFVAEKLDRGWEPAVSDTIQELGAKPIETMTVQEFRDFKDAIDSLAYIGREENKINVAGEKMEFDAFKTQVIENLKTLPPRTRANQNRWFYKIDAELTNMEQIVKDLDLRQELGPLYRAVIEPMMLSKAKEFDLIQELSNHFKATKSDLGAKWQKSLSDVIPNDFITDPHDLVPYNLTRENLLQIMLNWGNRSNIEKFTQGQATVDLMLRQEKRKATKEEAAAMEIRVKDLIDKYATKEDWQFVSEMWEPFKKWQALSDVVSRNTSGIAPKWIKAEPIQTPFGEIEGGYWPIKFDRLGSALSVIEDKKPSADALFGPNYFRAATAKGYLKERTGYIDAINISDSVTQAAGVMQQAIHDIAFRDALMQAGKVFYDKEIRAAIKRHYGAEYEAQLIPWLKRIANKNMDDPAIAEYNRWLRATRTNLVGHALPLNIKVILSPDVGVPDPRVWAAFEANRAANVKLAMEKSNEIRHMVYNMDRDYREQLEQLTTHRGLMSKTQRAAVDWGFLPMMKFSQEFRMATFVDQYEKALARGLTEHEASVVADSFVRERHGAASVVDLPAIMASSEGMKWLTMFYGYFSTMRNWQRQIPGQIRRREYKNLFETSMGSIVVGAFFTTALFGKPEKDENILWTFAKALVQQPLLGIPVIRDAANLLFEGHRPSPPIAALFNAAYSVGTEAARIYQGKSPKKPVQAVSNVIGLSTGLPMLQIGKTGQFAYDVATGKQRPKDMIDWWRGIIHGNMEPWKR